MAVTKKKTVCGSRRASQNWCHFHSLSFVTVWFSRTLSIAIVFWRSSSHRALLWLSGMRYMRTKEKARLSDPKKRKKIFHVAIELWTGHKGISTCQSKENDLLIYLGLGHSSIYHRRSCQSRKIKIRSSVMLVGCKLLTGVPLSQNAVLKACSGRVHQLLVMITKTGPIILSHRPRKNRIVAIPAKFVHLTRQ